MLPAANVCEYVEEVKRYVEHGVQDRDYQIRPPVLYLRLVEPPTHFFLPDAIARLTFGGAIAAAPAMAVTDDGGHCIVSVF